VVPGDSCSHYIQQKHQMRDLLPTMHPISDPRDISPPKFGYNFPRKTREHSELRSSVEDFIQPKSLTGRRSTGYNRGHIRSILELDTFGPQHSEVVTDARLSGSLPLSPNIDRNRSPTGSRSGREGGDGNNDLSSRSTLTTLNKSQSLPGFGGNGWDAMQYAQGTGRDIDHPLLQTTTEGFSVGHDPRGASLKYSTERKRKLKVISQPFLFPTSKSPPPLWLSHCNCFSKRKRRKNWI
jgi:hypothetical protein